MSYVNDQSQSWRLEAFDEGEAQYVLGNMHNSVEAGFDVMAPVVDGEDDASFAIYYTPQGRRLRDMPSHELTAMAASSTMIELTGRGLERVFSQPSFETHVHRPAESLADPTLSSRVLGNLASYYSGGRVAYVRLANSAGEYQGGVGVLNQNTRTNTFLEVPYTFE